jgi:isopentenyldiphosphate isomerase
MSVTQEDELLEIWDWMDAAPTGKAAPRALCHRTGIPHEGVHLWIMRRVGDSAEVLFQHRSLEKKMYPDCLDITVGGHVPFGLSDNKIHKEAEEELGIVPDGERLIDLGWFRYEERGGDVFHREFQHVYLLMDNRALDEYSFKDGEVIGIYGVPLDNLLRLMREDHAFEVSGFDGEKIFIRKVSRRDFHPLLFSSIMEGYMDVVLAGMGQMAGARRCAPAWPWSRKGPTHEGDHL